MFDQEEYKLTEEEPQLGIQRLESEGPFEIPKDYFLHFPGHVVDFIRLLNAEDPAIHISASNPYLVPPSYFDQFHLGVLKVIDEEQERRDAFLGNLPKQLPLQIPQGYFNGLPENLLGVLRSQQGEPKLDAPDAPELGAQEETATLSPMLARMERTMPYELPRKYFDGAVGKSVPFVSPAVKSITWMRWAAAAIILMIFSIGGLQFLGIDKAPEASVADIRQRLAEIPENEIEEYLSVTLSDYDVTNLSQNYSFQAYEEF